MPFIHLDEAKRAAIEHVKQRVHEVAGIERALLGADLFGRLRVVLWASPDVFEQVQARLRVDRAARRASRSTGCREGSIRYPSICGRWIPRWSSSSVHAAPERLRSPES